MAILTIISIIIGLVSILQRCKSPTMVLRRLQRPGRIARNQLDELIEDELAAGHDARAAGFLENPDSVVTKLAHRIQSELGNLGVADTTEAAYSAVFFDVARSLSLDDVKSLMAEVKQ